jgi:hypothetical protein
VKTKQSWQHLPDSVESGDYSSPEARQMAVEINSAIEAIEDQREACDAAAAKLMALPDESDDLDQDSVENDAKALRVAVTQALKAEIAVRELLDRYYILLAKNIESATANWQAEIPVAMEAGRAALRTAGFGGYIDWTGHNPDHQSRVNNLLYSYPAVGKLASKVQTARDARVDHFQNELENRRFLAAVRERLTAAKRAMVPAV